LDAASFEFRVGNTPDPYDWLPGPVPDSIGVRPGAGVGGSDRVTIIWPDYAILGSWLQVTVLATAETGLSSPYVFYFGNAPGESGNSPGHAFVDATDFAGARDNPRDFLHPAPIDFRFDYNRDSFVDATDMAIARDHTTNFVTALKLLDLRGPIVPSSEPLPGSSVPVGAMFDATSSGFRSAGPLTVQEMVLTPIPLRASGAASDALPNTALEAVPDLEPSGLNVAQPLDVTGDGQVTVLDALAVIQHINARPNASLSGPASDEAHRYPDVNGDGLCMPLDALWVINWIHAGKRGIPEGEESPEATPDVPAEPPQVISPGPMPTSARPTRPSRTNPDVAVDHRDGTSPLERIPVAAGDARLGRLEDAPAITTPAARRNRDEPASRFIDPAEWDLDAVLEDLAPDLARIWSGQT
jgi:hypothetical protein